MIATSLLSPLPEGSQYCLGETWVLEVSERDKDAVGDTQQRAFPSLDCGHWLTVQEKLGSRETPRDGRRVWP